MLRRRFRPSLPYYLPQVVPPSAGERLCPRCHGQVERVRRRWIDRLASVVSPLQRYRCQAKGWGCDWEGNLR